MRLASIPILHNNRPTAPPVDPRTMRPYGPKVLGMSRDTIIKGAKEVQKSAVIKPGRMLGACYISDKAECQGSVKLCDACVTKYYGFWKQTGHRPSWNNYFTSDCDGCSQSWMLVTLFLPEDQFDKVLGGAHGRYSSPKKTVFSRLFTKENKS